MVKLTFTEVIGTPGGNVNAPVESFYPSVAEAAEAIAATVKYAVETPNVEISNNSFTVTL